MHIFSELADNGLYGCIPVVVADRRKWGHFKADSIRTKYNHLAQFCYVVLVFYSFCLRRFRSLLFGLFRFANYVGLLFCLQQLLETGVLTYLSLSRVTSPLFSASLRLAQQVT